MEKPKRNTPTAQRDRDLYRAYLERLKAYGEVAKDIAKHRLYYEAVHSPAPRFYISEEEAGRIIQNMTKKGDAPKKELDE